MSDEMFVTRVAESRVRLELQTLDELDAAIAALRAHGIPGEAEVEIERGSFGPPHLVARYWPEGEDDGDTDDPDDDESLAAAVAPQQEGTGE